MQPIEVKSDNAKAIIELTAQDLRRAGLSTDEVDEIADPLNPKHRERQLLKLAEYPGRYLGVFTDRDLVGFSKTNDWEAADQLPFASYVERLAIRPMAKFKYGGRLDGRPFGIHGLVVSQEIDSPDEAADSLIKRALAAAALHEIRIAQYPGDPIQPLLRKNGFEPTGKFGKPIGNLRQELFVRPHVVDDYSNIHRIDV